MLKINTWNFDRKNREKNDLFSTGIYRFLGNNFGPLNHWLSLFKLLELRSKILFPISSKNILKEQKKFTSKIDIIWHDQWSIYKFLIAQLNDFDYEKFLTEDTDEPERRAKKKIEQKLHVL